MWLFQKVFWILSVAILMSLVSIVEIEGSSNTVQGENKMDHIHDPSESRDRDGGYKIKIKNKSSQSNHGGQTTHATQSSYPSHGNYESQPQYDSGVNTNYPSNDYGYGGQGGGQGGGHGGGHGHHGHGEHHHGHNQHMSSSHNDGWGWGGHYYSGLAFDTSTGIAVIVSILALLLVSFWFSGKGYGWGSGRSYDTQQYSDYRLAGLAQNVLGAVDKLYVAHKKA